ncbi:FG-GAP repeat protein [Pararhizobium polonicum]|nr:FG-GAP repeat protein [Pararhizobium polonicum]
MKMSLAVMTVFSGLSAISAQAAQAIDPDRVISATTGDWDKDGNTDLAMLVAAPAGSDEDHAVYVYLNDGDTGRLTLKTVATNKVWGNLTMAGQVPSITALPNGSILITSRNDAVGRDRWEQKLTIAYRNFDFAVAGYTYTSYDTLIPDNTTHCDFNVLTGKGKRNDEPVAVTGELIFLKDWNDDRGQAACGNR